MQNASNNPKIKNRNLTACKGNNFIYKVLAKYFPGYYKKRLEEYDQQQLLRMLISHEGERYREDFSACLNGMLNK